LNKALFQEEPPSFQERPRTTVFVSLLIVGLGLTDKMCVGLLQEHRTPPTLTFLRRILETHLNSWEIFELREERSSIVKSLAYDLDLDELQLTWDKIEIMIFIWNSTQQGSMRLYLQPHV